MQTQSSSAMEPCWCYGRGCEVPYRPWDLLNITLALVFLAPQLSTLWSSINWSSFTRGYPGAYWCEKAMGWEKAGVSHYICIFLPHHRMLVSGILVTDLLLILGIWLQISTFCDIARIIQTPEVQWCFCRVEGRLALCHPAEGFTPCQQPIAPLIGLVNFWLHLGWQVNILPFTCAGDGRELVTHQLLLPMMHSHLLQGKLVSMFQHGFGDTGPMWV